MKAEKIDGRLLKGNFRREEIINAGCTLAMYKGLYNFTLKDVATVARINRGGIHYHFKEKEELLVEISNRFKADQELMKDLETLNYAIFSIQHKYGDTHLNLIRLMIEIRIRDWDKELRGFKK